MIIKQFKFNSDPFLIKLLLQHKLQYTIILIYLIQFYYNLHPCIVESISKFINYKYHNIFLSLSPIRTFSSTLIQSSSSSSSTYPSYVSLVVSWLLSPRGEDESG